jgi:HNH endonuclease
VGEVPPKFNFFTDKILQISAKGRGSRQMCRVNRYGFPRTSAKASKSVKGFQTGDMVKVIVLTGSKQGEYLGRVAVKSSGYFDIQTRTKTIEGIGYKYCHIVQRSDGYLYSYNERSSLGNE